MFNMKKKEDFEKYREWFEGYEYSYELNNNCIIINNKWCLKIIISLTSRHFDITIENTDEGKDIVIYEGLFRGLMKLSKEWELTNE